MKTNSITSTQSAKILTRVDKLGELGRECDRLLSEDPVDLNSLECLVTKYREALCPSVANSLQARLGFIKDKHHR